MNVTKVKTNGTGYNAIIDDIERISITEESRFYPLIMAWIDEGNIPDPEFTDEEIAANEVNLINAGIDAELKAIDLASIRSLREYVASQPDAPQFLKDRENEAITKRNERV